MKAAGPVVISGIWLNRATGYIVRDPEAWNDIIFVHVGSWGWFGGLDYFLAEWEGIDDEQGRGPGRGD